MKVFVRVWRWLAVNRLMKRNDHRKLFEATRAAVDEMNEEVCNTADENLFRTLAHNGQYIKRMRSRNQVVIKRW